MTLSILTPRGQQSVRDLDRAVALWESNNPGYRYCRTPEDSTSAVDGFIFDKDGILKGVVEAKCRYDMDERKFEVEYRSEWLVTMEKLVKGSRIASQLCVPYYGFLYIVSGGVLMTRKLADAEGQFCVPFRCENTATKKNVNGGEAFRANAYIDMRSSRVFRA